MLKKKNNNFYIIKALLGICKYAFFLYGALCRFPQSDVKFRSEQKKTLWPKIVNKKLHILLNILNRFVIWDIHG